MSQHYLVPVFAFAVVFALAGASAGQTPTSTGKPDGPVQGYQGGYDPIDKSKAPAASGGRKSDAGNADEGRRGRQASGTVAQIDGRKVTLDSGLVLVVPPTLAFDEQVLGRGTRVKASYEQQAGANVVTSIARE
jgi:hypothetical protein